VIGEFKPASALSCAASSHSRMLFNVKVVSRVPTTTPTWPKQAAARATSPTSRSSATRTYTTPAPAHESDESGGRRVTDHSCPARDHRGSASTYQGSAGSYKPPHHHRSQADRQDYLVFAWFLIAGHHGADHAQPSWRSREPVRQRRAVQPALHDARHDHAADVRDAAVRGFANVLMPLQIGAPTSPSRD
jgi:hypothetical protein